MSFRSRTRREDLRDLGSTDAMYEDLKDPHFAPPVLLRKKVAAGQFGRKSRKGFYDYGTSPHSSGEAA